MHWGSVTKSIVYGNKGVASYYLDEWNAKGRDADEVNEEPSRACKAPRRSNRRNLVATASMTAVKKWLLTALLCAGTVTNRRALAGRYAG